MRKKIFSFLMVLLVAALSGLLPGKRVSAADNVITVIPKNVINIALEADDGKSQNDVWITLVTEGDNEVGKWKSSGTGFRALNNSGITSSHFDMDIQSFAGEVERITGERNVVIKSIETSSGGSSSKTLGFDLRGQDSKRENHTVKYISDGDADVETLTGVTFKVIDNTSQDMTLGLVPAGKYTLKLDNLPDGYTYNEQTITVVESDSEQKFTINLTVTHKHSPVKDKWEQDDNEHWHACAGCEEKLDTESHTLEWKIDKEATYTATGLKHQECKICGYKTSLNTEISVISHDHKDGEASCKAKAICELCGNEYGDFNSSNHKNTELRNDVLAAADSAGYTGDTYCADCGTLISEGSVIPALKPAEPETSAESDVPVPPVGTNVPAGNRPDKVGGLGLLLTVSLLIAAGVFMSTRKNKNADE